jgi:hypothetical protein
MIQKEEEPIAGGILADGCRIGKTLQGLSLIYVQAQRVSAPGLFKMNIYQPERVTR